MRVCEVEEEEEGERRERGGREEGERRERGTLDRAVNVCT